MQYELGVDHLQNDRSPQAIAALLEAKRCDPSSELTQLALAEAYRQQGRLAEAEMHLKNALALKSGLPPGALNLAALYIQIERYEEAVSQLQTLLDDPTFPAPVACAHEPRLGRVPARPARRSAPPLWRWRSTIDPQLLARSLQSRHPRSERGNRAEAIQHFEQVLEQKPGPLAEAEVRFRLAEQLESSGDRQGARSTAHDGERSPAEWTMEPSAARNT